MLKSPEEVYDLLIKLWEPALKRAKSEVLDMQAVSDSEGNNFKIAAWDWWHYSVKVRKAKYDLDEAELKPYLSLDNVIKGVFNTTNKLWGLTFTEIFDIELYHPDTRIWNINDKDVSHLVIFIFYLSWMQSQMLKRPPPHQHLELMDSSFFQLQLCLAVLLKLQQEHKYLQVI